jgi:hypothetical protein
VLALMRDEAAVYVGNPADVKGKTVLDIISIASDQRLIPLPDIPTFKEQGYDLNESMWRGFAYKKGVPDEAVQYVTRILQKVVLDEEWINYCNESFVFSNFEGKDEFTRRITDETAETNHYLNKAGMLVSYVKVSSVHPVVIFFLIALAVFFLLFAYNRFDIRKFNYDQIVAGGILSISFFFLYQTFLFQIPGSVIITSPSLIPRIWIITLILLSILLIFRSESAGNVTSVTSPGTVWIIITFLLVYLVAMQWIGYYITTPVFILSAMYLLKYRKISIMAINALGENLATAGAVSTATSVGITARILSEKKKIQSPEGVTILSGAIIDDVLGVIMLAIVIGISKTGHVEWSHVMLIGIKSIVLIC